MAAYVIDNDENGGSDQEVLAYGYSLLIMAVVNYVVIISSSLLFGVFREMMFSLGAFMLMRTTIGGVHANHRGICLATTMTTLYLGIVLSDVLTLNLYVVLAMYALNIMLLVLYAPGDTTEQPMVRNRFLRKILGIALVSCIFASYAFFGSVREVNILLIVSTLICVLLHPYFYKLYKCERSSYS